MVFKSSAFVIVKNVVYGIFGGGLVALIANWFLDLKIALAAGVIVGLFIIYFALIGDNVKVTIEGDTLSFYRLGKLKNRFAISSVGLYAKIKTTDGDSDCMLTVTEENGSETHIDCSMLGKSRFYKLLDALHVTDAEPKVVETKKKHE